MRVVLREPLDMHLHLRDGELLEKVVNFTSKNFSGAIVMPNLIPPLTTKEAIDNYKNRILELTKDDNFEPYMTIFLKEALSYETLKELKNSIKGVKLYPSGVTTNSETGLASIDTEVLKDTFNAMSELDLPLLIHGETNGFVLDREKEFLPIFEDIASKFPKLKVIMEHISTKEAVELLEKYDNLYATVTLHHLLLTFDDVAGGKFQPHLFCKPVVKKASDRDALIKLVTSGNKKVMFGSDSAPHTNDNKACLDSAAGVFTAPVLLPALVELFEKYNALDKLQEFISDNAKAIYGVNPSQKEIVLEKKEFIVPNSYADITPILCGESISWSIVR